MWLSKSAHIHGEVRTTAKRFDVYDTFTKRWFRALGLCLCVDYVLIYGKRQNSQQLFATRQVSQQTQRKFSTHYDISKIIVALIIGAIIRVFFQSKNEINCMTWFDRELRLGYFDANYYPSI